MPATLYVHSAWRPPSCAERWRFARNSVWAFHPGDIPKSAYCSGVVQTRQTCADVFRRGETCFTPAPARPTDWNQMKKRELKVLDASFPISVAPMRSHPKTHVGRPVRIHKSGATKTGDEASHSDKRVFSHAVDRSLPMNGTDSTQKHSFGHRGQHAVARFRAIRPQCRTLRRSRAGNARCERNLATASRSR